MRNVVVLGGGFAGVRAGLAIIKHSKELDIRINLIDRNNFHIFTPSLYEVATSEQPQKNIAIPFKEIFGNKINIVKGEVTTIDSNKKAIKLKGNTDYGYDYLIIALGSESAYFGIAGLKEYSLPLKTLPDAVKIQRVIEKYYDKKDHKKDKLKTINVIIGGGGFSGTELSAELINYKDRLSRKFYCDKECIKLTVIQGSERLLKELDTKASEVARRRLKAEGVLLRLAEHIQNVTSDTVMTDQNKSYKFDVFIWTGGVKAASVVGKSGFTTNKRGQVLVNDSLQVVGFDNIFAAGDVAEFKDPVSGRFVPWVAQIAEDEGKIAGENVYRIIKGLPLKKYHFSHFGYIVPLKGHFAILQLKNIHIVGFFGWMIQQFVLLRYLLGILPFFKALKRWNKFERELEQR